MPIEEYFYAAFFILLLGSLVTVPVVASIKMRNALRTVAAQLKLRRSTSHGDPQMMDAESYEGTVNGLRVRITKGWRVYQAGGRLVPLQGIYVEAFHATPYPFEIDIARKGSLQSSDLQTGDADFDKQCVVTTNDVSTARSVVADKAIRRRIASFLKGQKGLAHVTTEAVTTRFVNSWKGAPLLRDTLRQCLIIAIELGKLRPAQ